MNALAGALPILLLLACPAMMIVCFWGMRRMSCSHEPQPVSSVDTAAVQNLSPSEQARLLQSRLERLQVEQKTIASQLERLASLEPVTARTTAAPQNGSAALEERRA